MSDNYTYTIKNDITFYMEGLKVTEVAPETIAAPTETVSVINDSRNLTGDGAQGLYFGVTPSDGLPYDDQRGEMHYSAASGGVYVNGELLEEPYVREKGLGDCDLEFPYKVPGTSYFLLGDQRSNSVDSRNSAIGAVERDDIIGKVFLRVWPFSRFGLVH